MTGKVVGIILHPGIQPMDPVAAARQICKARAVMDCFIVLWLINRGWNSHTTCAVAIPPGCLNDYITFYRGNNIWHLCIVSNISLKYLLKLWHTWANGRK